MHRLTPAVRRAHERCRAARFGVALAVLLAPASALAAPYSIGLAFTGARLTATFPPDTQGAVGPDHIVILLNGQYRVYEKETGASVVASTLSEFWIAAGIASPGGPFDPRVVYDAGAKRWYASCANHLAAPNEILFAVSASADPTGGWTGFAVPSDTSDQTWADFPMLGYNATGVYVAAPLYAFAGDEYVIGVDVLVLPKADLLAATPSIANATLLEKMAPAPLGGAPHPVADLDGSAVSALFVSGAPSVVGLVPITAVTGSIEDPSLMVAGAASVEIHEPPPLAAQPGPKPDLETSPGDTRFSSSVVLRGGSIWAVHGVRIDGRPALRLLEIDAATLAVRQDQPITSATLDLYYPSIAVNARGDVVIGASASSEATFVGAYAWIGETSGGATHFGEPIELRAGASDYQRLDNGRNRWGDYSATVLDPTDDAVFWTFQEFVVAENQWGIHVAEIRVPEPHGAPAALGALAVLAHRARGFRRKTANARRDTAAAPGRR